MGSNRSRKLKAREAVDYNLDEIFAQIAAAREGKTPEKEEEQSQPKAKKEQKDNPNHPCYKCLGCPGWTRCPGYYQLLECIEQRRKAYEKKIGKSE